MGGMVKIGVIGALGYVLILGTALISLFITLPTELSLVVSIVAVIGAIILGVAWYCLGRRLEDELMKLFGVLMPGVTLLCIALIGAVVIIYMATGIGGINSAMMVGAIATYVVPAIILFWIITHLVGPTHLVEHDTARKPELMMSPFQRIRSSLDISKQPMREIVGVLLILTIIGLVGSVFFGLLAWLFLVGFIGLLISWIVFHVRSLLAAGTKLKSRYFRFAGWSMLISALLIIVCMALSVYFGESIGSFGSLGLGGTAGSQLSLTAVLTKWIVYARLIFYAAAMALGTIAFIGIRERD